MMGKLIKRIVALAVIFILTYVIVVGVRHYFSKNADSKPPEYQREAYTYLEKSEIDDESVELLNRLNQEFTHLAENSVQSVVSIHTSAQQTQI